MTGGRPSGHRPPREAGLQAERTSLAWSRTALAVLVNAVLVIRAGLTGHAAPVIAGGAILVLAAIGVAAAGRRRSARLLRDHNARSADRLVTGVFAVAVGCTITALSLVALA